MAEFCLCTFVLLISPGKRVCYLSSLCWLSRGRNTRGKFLFLRFLFIQLKAGKLQLPELESTSSTKEVQRTQNTNVIKNLLEQEKSSIKYKILLKQDYFFAFSTRLQAVYRQAENCISFHSAFSPV